jgi:hypothetical protein
VLRFEVQIPFAKNQVKRLRDVARGRPDSRSRVANQYDNDIHVYAAGAVGDSPPIATISGGATALSGPGAIAITPPLSILTRRLPTAVAHRRYYVRLRASEGRTPYSWSLAHGKLIAGLRLSRSGSSQADRAAREPHTC